MPSGAKIRLALLASGGGSNVDQICAHFTNHPDIEVRIIITNNAHAGVIQIAKKHQVPCYVFPKDAWTEPAILTELLEVNSISHIILAGFLLLIPAWLIALYPHRIVNIHPALLPKHGGKGMFGHHVHRAVKNAGELISGITIHEVNAHYDDGNILFQHEVLLDETDTPEDIGAKVLRAEHYYYPKVIERWVLGKPVVHPLLHQPH
jgi:phosphoribosylglycinamide formyltransferase-1